MSKNLLTIEAFAEWCEKQPARKGFNINSVANCALGQYAKSIGFPCGSNPDFTIDAGGGRSLDIDGLTIDAMTEGKRTFGELAKRLRSLSA
jgi:hypothetical protein